MGKSVLFAVSAMLVLGACGGDGSTDGSPEKPRPVDGSFSALWGQESAFLAKYYGPSFRPSPTASSRMPQSGSASYTGVAALSKTSRALYGETLNGELTFITRDQPEYAGKATINANFAEQTVSGQIDQFRNSANEPVAGSITLTHGQIEGAKIGIERGIGSDSISGNLTIAGVPHTVTGSYSGQFVGDSAQGLDATMYMLAWSEDRQPTQMIGNISAEK